MAQGGNPNHAPAGAPGGTGGQFVSGPQSGAEQGTEKNKQKKSIQKKAINKKAFNKKPVVNEASLDRMFAMLSDLNQSIEVPLLNGAEELEQNIEKLFTKKAISHLDRLWGVDNKFTKYFFHPKSNPGMNLNLFTCVMGKYRYPDNHAHFVSDADFQKMLADKEHYTACYRGFSSEGEKRKNILKGYGTADIDNLDIYGNGVFGTNIYTSTSYDYALGYANRSPDKVLHCVVDRSAKKVRTEDLRNEFDAKLRSSYDWSISKRVDKPLMISICNKFETHLVNNNIEPNKAKEMAQGLKHALEDDISLYAILLGYDYQVSSGGSQRNILNLSKWYINGDKTGVR